MTSRRIIPRSQVAVVLMAALLAGVPALGAAAAHTPPPPLALVGATLLDGNRGTPVGDSVVVIRAGRIACAGTRDSCPVPPGVESLDLSGRYLTPGLIDAHVHFSQSGWVDARPDAVDVSNRYPFRPVSRYSSPTPRGKAPRRSSTPARAPLSGSGRSTPSS